nr:hypothetical protein [uncultured Duganella sp.]
MKTFLRESANPMSVTAALVAAVNEWIEHARAAAYPARGYQWKMLFLPETTLVRMYHAEHWHVAQVVGDDLLYQGETVSPHQLAQEVAGDGRNAWRALWVRLPGEKTWTNAGVLRSRLQQRAAKPAPTALEAMNAAADAMGKALDTALVLIEHVDHQSRNTLERRLPKHRRQDDLLDDID